MKKGTLVITLAITAITLVAFTFSNPQEKELQKNLGTANITHKVISALNIKKTIIVTKENLNYMVRGSFAIPVHAEKIKTAKSIADFIPDYPSTWISNYEEVTLTNVTTSKNQLKITSKNDAVSPAQKKLLNRLSIGALLQVKVQYSAKNEITQVNETKYLNTTLNIIPDVEAQFEDGNEQLITYLKSASLDKIAPESIPLIKQGSYTFIINNIGEIQDVKCYQTCGVQVVDKLILDVLKKMPNWKPAETSDGNKVSQQFEFLFGEPGC